MYKIYFATNRKPDNEDKPTNYSSEIASDGINLRFGYAEYESSSKSTFKIETYPDVKNENGEYPSILLFKELQQSMTNKNRDTIIYIHGYNTSFNDSILTGIELKEKLQSISNSNYDPNIFVFTWPSNGSATAKDYYEDTFDAQRASFGFYRGIQKLNQFISRISRKDHCGQKLHIFAHSMGVYMLRLAFQYFIKLNPLEQNNLLFSEVILMAGDEDSDSFEFDHKLKKIHHIANRTTTYFNKEDKVFSIRERKIDRSRRLGKQGTDTVNLPKDVYQVDATPVVDFSFWQKAKDLGKILEHTYFLNTEEVFIDLYEVFIGIDSEKCRYREYVPASNKYRLKKEQP